MGLSLLTKGLVMAGTYLALGIIIVCAVAAVYFVIEHWLFCRSAAAEVERCIQAARDEASAIEGVHQDFY